MNPLVSVIIPVYNVKPYLREALDSVIGQTYRRLEIIIVDDGSTDGSGDICDEYSSDPRVTVIHQANGGLSNARNKGLTLAKGEYLCFIDSDDSYHKAFIEKLLNNAQSTQAEIVVCKYNVQKTAERLIVNKLDSVQKWPRLASGVYSRADALRFLVEGILDVPVWNKLYKSNLWNDVRFPDGHNYEDIDTIYRVVDTSQTISMIEEVLYFYRDRFDSITHNSSAQNTRDWMLAHSHLEAFILSRHPEVFSDTLVERYKHRYLDAYMVMYARWSGDSDFSNELRKTIVEKGRELKQWNIRTRIAYFMVCFSPLLFKFAYKVYLPCRLSIWKVMGK